MAKIDHAKRARQKLARDSIKAEIDETNSRKRAIEDITKEKKGTPLEKTHKLIYQNGQMVWVPK